MTFCVSMFCILKCTEQIFQRERAYVIAVQGQYQSYKIDFVWYLFSYSGLSILLLCNTAYTKP